MEQVHDEIGLILGAVEEIRRITIEQNVAAGGMGSDRGDRIFGAECEGIGSVDIKRSVAILVVVAVGPEREVIVVIQGRGGMGAPPWAAVLNAVKGDGDGGVRRHSYGDSFSPSLFGLFDFFSFGGIRSSQVTPRRRLAKQVGLFAKFVTLYFIYLFSFFSLSRHP